MITVFTPAHRLDHLSALYESLKAQTFQDFEWVVLLNGAAEGARLPFRDDTMVKEWHSYFTGSVGALKAECCTRARGDILVEVDHDDQLTPDALEKIAAAFEDPAVQFVYSNCVELRPDGSSNVYSERYGWHSRPYGENTQMVAFPARAQYLRRIEWAPNHVRAFRRTAYDRIGGYDRSIAVGDDHDLMCRFYIAFGEAGFRHIDECLYLYRVHEGNTSNGANRNAEVQAQVDANYCRWAEAMYMRWAFDNYLYCLDLGGRFNKPVGYTSVDLRDADINADLTEPWPWADNSVGVLRAYHLLEHLPDTIHFMNEAFRVLAPGGFLLIEVPSTNGPDAFADPTHVKFFNLQSFEYYTNQAKAQYIQPQYTGRFQKARVVEYAWPDGTMVVSAQLIALKGWYNERWCGEKLI